ncbi:hypothetical protein [Vibrio splendidus]|uniref:hypothetical protein n=1 Tax=Vibrio splendidus TaxID=29497 RepID=UPI00076A5A5C|nr:hypothetical protein [Vibrio splendidus]PHX05501.1 hypothetical protein VSPL_28950 [Vibrio splendidus]
MTDKMKIVYIGPNEEKKMSRGFSEYIFPRGVAVSIDEQNGYELLKFKDTFATPEQAKEIMKQNEELKEAERLAAEKQRLQQHNEDAANTYLVIIDGEVLDISKFTKAKLSTIVVSEGLSIDVNKPIVQDDESPVEALRNRIRESLHEKHGNPELKEA